MQYTPSATSNICDLNLLYDEEGGFEYSLPRNILEGFLSGKAFDNPNPYTSEELSKLFEDINGLFQAIISTNPIKANVAVISAGAPGSGKTTKIKQELEQTKKWAYVCPDDVCLENQERTYKADIASCDGSFEARKKAYDKWRPGSNAATHLILGNLIRAKYGFYFGSTSSSFATGYFFEFLKKQGYQIQLIHLSAPDDVRWESIQERDKEFVQTTESDVREKGLLVPQRIQDTYLKFADEIEFYYRDEVKKNAVLAARWLREDEEDFQCPGMLEIVNHEAYEKIKLVHNTAIHRLEKTELLWENTLEAHSKIVANAL